MKNKRRGLKEQPRKKPLDIEKKIRNPYKYEEQMHFDNLCKGELYLPESCKGKKLAMLCNRLYYFNINDEELLERYAERASVIANSMSTKEMSLILNTMRKFNYRNEKLLETFSKHIPSKLHKGVPQDISLILNAYSHFNYKDKNLINRICEEIPHKIPHFQPSHISSVISAFYKLQIRDQIIIDDMIDEIIERIDEFDTKSLTNIINSFSKLNYKNDNKYILWKKCIQAVKKLDKEFNFLEIVLITNALCKEHIVKIKNKNNAYIHDNNDNNNIYTHLCEVIKYKIYEEKCLNVHTNSFLLCTVAHSLSKVKYYDKDLFHFIIEYFSDENNYISLDNQHFSQLIYSSYIFNIDKPEFINMFIKVISNRIENKQLNEQALSTICYSLAKLKIRNIPFFILLSSYIIKQKIQLSTQSLSLICYSYSKLLIKSEMLFYILSIQIFQHMNMFTKQGLSIILSSYANLKIFNVKMFSLINKYMNLYLPNFTKNECLLICSHYEHALKNLNDSVNKNNDDTKMLVNKTSKTKKELNDFVESLKEKISKLEDDEKIKNHDNKNKIINNEEKDVDIFDDENIFSIFKQNDILNDHHEDNNNTSNSEIFNIPNSNNTLHTSDGYIINEDIKKKEDTLKLYQKIFLDHKNVNSNILQNVSLNNEIFSQQLSSLIDKQNETNQKMNNYQVFENYPKDEINEQTENTSNISHTSDISNNTQLSDHLIHSSNQIYNNNQKTKSLIDLMTSNKPPIINSEKENLIKSAEQMETEFIRDYINQQQDSHHNSTMGRNHEKRKHKKNKIKNLLSKNNQTVNDLNDLKKKWNEIYKK
ncbi:conserved Plasmodium protein, unknown function [Plasmodium sp. gorilla clade G2]|uniref:conserved Plasmodium protein, unknown function n=1 Tax=Plasmodium sp. gorilla clade G2 TaxID=880535 RepID=UPI000D222169|nr:conserved Plasmodium protein, unknown function [Plasmodium sp. gorilla clade G2]SOV16858.1 conserved Plasmodium protein, unknown function [Plasmodium sp. gorilla clade G2]